MSIDQYWENYEREDDQLRRQADITRRARYAGGREIEAERLEPDADRGEANSPGRHLRRIDIVGTERQAWCKLDFLTVAVWERRWNTGSDWQWQAGNVGYCGHFNATDVNDAMQQALQALSARLKTIVNQIDNLQDNDAH